LKNLLVMKINENLGKQWPSSDGVVVVPRKLRCGQACAAPCYAGVNGSAREKKGRHAPCSAGGMPS